MAFLSILNIDTLIFYFLLFSTAGWLLEVIYRSIENRRFINPGFNRGPWVPLYGIAAVIVIATNDFVQDQPIHIRALVYLTVTTGLEYVTGEALLMLFKKRYWDYRSSFLNLRGHICLSFSIAWVIAAFVFEFLLYPLSIKIVSLLNIEVVKTANVLILSLLTVDFFNSSGLYTRTITVFKQGTEPLMQKIDNLINNIDLFLAEKDSFRVAGRRLVQIYANNIEDIDLLVQKTRQHFEDLRQRLDIRKVK